jgi:sugar/nucleoside kinase (ribokinase family)
MRSRQWASGASRLGAVRGIAVIGNLSRDVIDGGAPRVGGAPYHAARALRLLGGNSRIVARCAESDRRALVGPLAALGVPFEWLAAPSTTAFELRYTGEEREMTIPEPGAPWSVKDVRAVGRADWVQVGALTRGDFAPDVLAAIARHSRIALDGQALVRPAAKGPLVLDADFDPDVLRHVTALKLNEEELETLGGEERVAELRVPELLLTQGSTGGVVIARGARERVPVRPILTTNPTGAGDAFLAGYVWARSAGHRPGSAARYAATTAARVLELAT